MPDVSPPLLAERDVLTLARSNALPAEWRMALRSGELFPLVARGGEVRVEARPATRGALVCVDAGNRVVFRRVLAVRDDGKVLLRAEHAPFPDGWCDGVIGCVALDGTLAALVARAPEAWTATLWHARRALAIAHRTSSSLRSLAPRPRSEFTTRALTPADADAFRAFYSEAWRTEAASIELRPESTTIGLFSAAGVLVGTTTLLRLDDRRALSCSTIVAASSRGAGGGTRLLRAAIEHARTLGFEQVIGRVAVLNGASLTACTRAGFVRTGRWVEWPDLPLGAAEVAAVELRADLNRLEASSPRRQWSVR